MTSMHRNIALRSFRSFFANFPSVLFLASSGTLVPPTLAAQTGDVVGRVAGADGAIIPFAAIQWEGQSGWTAVRAEGDYTLAGVPVGRRTIVAQALGYRTTRQTVDVRAEQRVTLNFSLDTRPLDVVGIAVSVLRPDLTPVTTLEDREVREANPKDAGELLRSMAGVDAVRRGPLGLDPVVRGLRETEVGTYLDGTRLFPAGPARMDSPLTHLDPSTIRSIEVIKGPYALTWGAGNLSAIRVETQPLPRVSSGPRGLLGAGYDSNLGAAETSGNVFGRAGGIAYNFDGAWRQGDDYTSGADSIIPADYESWEARGKLSIDLGTRARLTVAGGYQEQGPLDYPGRLLSAESFKAPNVSATFDLDGADGGTLGSLELQAYRNHVDHTMWNREKPTAVDMMMRTPPCALDVDVDSKINVLGARLAAELALGGPWTAEVGGDVYSANRDATRTIRKADTAQLMCGNMLDLGMVMEDRMWPDATITDAGSFVRLGWREGRLSVSGTVRVDVVDADAPVDQVSTFFTANNPSGASLASTETNVSAALTGSLNLDQNWVLAVGIGSAVRTADATERFSDRVPASKAQWAAEFMGDPQLSPERSTQGDVWLDGRFPDVEIHLGAFARTVADYVTIAPTPLPTRLPMSPPTVYQYVNGDATFYGIDAHASVGLSELITLTVAGSYLYGQDDQIEEPAIGITPMRASAGVRYEEPQGRFYLEGITTAVGEQTRVSASRNEGITEGYTTMDLRSGFGLSNGITLRGGVINLLDAEYHNHLNARNPFTTRPIPEPGRVFYVDLAWAF